MKKAVLVSLFFLAVLFCSSAAAASPSEALFLQQQQTTAAPTISSLSPSSAVAGGASFTLTVDGANFVNGSTVRWNGQSRTTAFVSSTRLTASIPASDIAISGTATVTVVHPGGTTSNQATFTITPETALYFAQIAEGKISGGFYKTKLIIINPNNKLITALVEFFDSAGQPFPVDIGTGTLSPSFSLTIPAKSERLILTNGTKPVASAGWARLKSEDRIGGLIIYQFFNNSGNFVTEAGVASSGLLRKFLVPAEFKDDFESGLALVNPSETSSATVLLRLLDLSGNELARANRSLGPRQHRAEFVTELFAGMVPARLEGTIEVESSPSTAPLAPTTLRTLKGLQTSSLPVVVVPEGQ